MSKRKDMFLDLGYNYRMTNLQAAVGTSQIKNLKKILRLRDNQIKFYEKTF